LVWSIGDDERGRAILTCLHDEHIATRFVVTRAVPTGASVIQVENPNAVSLTIRARVLFIATLVSLAPFDVPHGAGVCVWRVRVPRRRAALCHRG
jgi:sugar/nucleoside kinase (ribokinase family)